MKMSRFRLTLAGGVLLLAVSGYAYFRHQDQDAGGYLTETIDRGTVASTVTANGTVNPVTSVQVGTYASGPIKAIYATFNSRVTKGQLVAKIDPAPFQVKVDSAAAQVANARAKVLKDKADLAFKKLTYGRNQRLFARGLIAQSDVDTAKNDHDQAAAQLALDDAAVQQAVADLGSAKISLGYTDITSPVDGVVVSRNVDVGQTVAASFQTPTLFLIAQDLTKMQVDTNVSESDIGGVQTGQPASFHVDAYPGRDFPGSVVQVRNAPITVQNVVTYDVVVAVDNPKLELRPGMTATITITTAKADDVLRIPARALRFHPERGQRSEPSPAPATAPAAGRPAHSPAVWLLQPDGEIKRVKIQTGVQNDTRAELVSGDLHENDVLVVGTKRSDQGTSAQRPQQQQQRPPSFMGSGGGGRFH